MVLEVAAVQLLAPELPEVAVRLFPNDLKPNACPVRLLANDLLTIPNRVVVVEAVRHAEAAVLSRNLPIRVT